MAKPLFSVGITTYRRHEELKKAIKSVLDQSISDFEIIVGNDYQGESLTKEILQIDDPRLIILNHPVNLREIGNMNALLNASSGQYFTWLADDDFCSPYFFEHAKKAIDQANNPPVVFTSFGVTKDYLTSDSFKQYADEDLIREIPGNLFVKDVLSEKIKAMGFCGVYRVDYVKSLGGIEPVVDTYPICLYAEFLLLCKVGLLKTIPYINAPLTFYRDHEQSWGVSNTDVDLYKIGGEQLLKKSAKWLTNPEQLPYIEKNLQSLLRLVLNNYYVKYWTFYKRFRITTLLQFIQSLKAAFAESPSAESHVYFRKATLSLTPYCVLTITKATLKSILPVFLLDTIRRLKNKARPV